MLALALKTMVGLAIAAGQVIGAEFVPRPNLTKKAKSRPAVEVYQTQPVRLVFLEHDGPYWTAGPVFSRVREYMREHDEPGPMFMRYHRRTADERAVSRTSQIGFVASGGHEPVSPFNAESVEGRRVARLFVAGKTPSPWRSLRLLDAWAADNHYEHGTEVMEVYHLGPRMDGGIERTEIHVPIHRQPELAIAADLAKPAPPSERTNSETEPDDAKADGSAVGVTTAAPVSKTAKSKFVSPTVPDDSIGRESSLQPAGEVESITVALAAGNFVRVAELILPDKTLVDFDEQVWLGRVLLRIKAAATGIERKHPGDGKSLVDLAAALLLRYRTMFATTQEDLLASVIGVGSTNAPGGEQRAIMRELDTLLGRIAFGAVGPQDTLQEIMAVLVRLNTALEG